MSDDVGVAEVEEWAEGLEEVRELIAPRFARSEPHQNAVAYLQGLLADRQRKNSWTLSEDAGYRIPDGMQRLLSTTDWDPDLVRDDLVAYVSRYLGDAEGVLVLDETGFIKKGQRSAGVARQYSGTAGRIENAQIGVFLSYATTYGRTLIDRELYIPKAWSQDADRSAAAGIPQERSFATKPELAGDMIDRAVAASVPAKWVTGDAVYGQPAKLRRLVEGHGLNYVLAVAANQHVIAADGPIGTQYRADELARHLDGRRWRVRSAGGGSKGQRHYRWARTPINGEDPEASYWLLVRQSLQEPQELAYYICCAPARTSLAELIRIAGARWTIEESFQTAKGEAGLDHYQVRKYTGWYRHITLSMLAHALLTVIRAKKGAPKPRQAS